VDEPNAAPAPIAREAPPSTLQVYGVLFGIAALVLLTCVGLTAGYAYFLHVKSFR
jgi:hypothetical protein